MNKLERYVEKYKNQVKKFSDDKLKRQYKAHKQLSDLCLQEIKRRREK